MAKREILPRREEQQRRQRAQEEQAIYEETKARFLNTQLRQELIEGNVSRSHPELLCTQ